MLKWHFTFFCITCCVSVFCKVLTLVSKPPCDKFELSVCGNSNQNVHGER